MECVYPWFLSIDTRWVFRDDDIVIFNYFVNNSSDNSYYEHFTIVDSDFRIYSLPNVFKIYSSSYAGNIIRDTDGTFWHCYSSSSHNVTVIGFTFKENYSGINITYTYTFVPSSVSLVSAGRSGQLRKFGNRLFIGIYNKKALIHDINSNTHMETDAYNMESLNCNYPELFAGPDSSGTVYSLYTVGGYGSSSSATECIFYKLGRYSIPSGGIAEPGASLTKYVFSYRGGTGCSITDNHGDIYFAVGYSYVSVKNGPNEYYIAVIKISNGTITTKNIDDPSLNAWSRLSIAVDSNHLYILLLNRVIVLNKNLDVQETVVMDDSMYTIINNNFSSDIINGKILCKNFLLDTSTFELIAVTEHKGRLPNNVTEECPGQGFYHNGAVITPLYTYSINPALNEYRLAFPNERQVRGVSIE